MKLTVFLSLCTIGLALYGMNPDQQLFLAIMNNDIQQVQTLIARPNFNINQPLVDDLPSRLIQAIVLDKYNEIIKLLIPAGADSTLPAINIDLKRDYPYDALLFAIATSKSIEIIKLIASAHNHKANFPALHAAVSINRQDIVKVLINIGINLNLQDPEGQTALMHAVDEGDKEMVTLLLQSGADFSLANVHEHTAFEIAKQKYKKCWLPSKQKEYQHIGKTLLEYYLIQKQLRRIKQALTQYFQKSGLTEDIINCIFAYTQLSLNRFDRLISADHQALQEHKQKCSIQ